jgi:hypothetical protein
MVTSSVLSSEPKVLPDDVLSAILSLAQKKAGKPRFAFRGHDSELQKIFRELTSKLDSPLLKFFVFSDSGPIPYSPVLNESISRLQLSGLIGRENPDYEVLFVRQAAGEYLDKVLRDRFSSDELQQLSQVAEEFLKLIKDC